MQIPTKIFHCLSQSILWPLINKSKTNTVANTKSYKSYKERERERERERENPEHEQNTSQNSQILKTQKLILRPRPITQHLKIAFIREREREPSQTQSSYNHSEAI